MEWTHGTVSFLWKVTRVCLGHHGSLYCSKFIYWLGHHGSLSCPEFIYYTDWRRESIIRVSKRGDQELTVRHGMGRMMGIRIYDPALQLLSSESFCFFFLFFKLLLLFSYSLSDVPHLHKTSLSSYIVSNPSLSPHSMSFTVTCRDGTRSILLSCVVNNPSLTQQVICSNVPRVHKGLFYCLPLLIIPPHPTK